MTNSTIIAVNEMSKSYPLEELKALPPTLAGRLAEVLTMPLRNYRRIRKLGEYLPSHDGRLKALDRVSFEVKRGEILGIIGNNGAGKSTLLKVLSRVTKPDSGEALIYGKVASLLEIGTGFHGELTGRENIFLMGTLLGMKRREVAGQLDAIVDFSGAGSFLDTPVKFYSSGMKLRLGFSVAAFLDTDVLLLDEIFAVGDMSFQRKCFEKISEDTKNGKTILMVSHDLATLEQLCKDCLLLDRGRVVTKGPPSEVMQTYLSRHGSSHTDLSEIQARVGNGSIRFKEVKVRGSEGRPPASGQPLCFELELENPIANASPRIDLRIDSLLGQRLVWMSSTLIGDTPAGVKKLSFIIDQNPLSAGSYYLTLFMIHQGQVTDHLSQAIRFDVQTGQIFPSGQIIPTRQSHLSIPFRMEI